MEDMIREEGGSQFTLQALFKEIKKRFLLIIAITLLCTAVGGVFGAFVVDTQYTSVGSMIVNGADLSESQNLATALKSIADPDNDHLYKKAVSKFNSVNPNEKIEAAQLKEAITIKTSSMLLNFEIVISNPKADDILEAFMRELSDFANSPKESVSEEESTEGEKVKEYKYPFGGKVDYISDASEPTNDSQTKVFKYMALFFILGIVGSMLLVFLSVMLNDTYADKTSLEADFDIDVLATIEDVSYMKEERQLKLEQGEGV